MRSLPLLLASAGLAIFIGTARSATPTVPGDLSQYKTATQLWSYIDSLQTKGDSARPELAEMRSLNAAATEFLKKYPNDNHALEAKLAAAQSEYEIASTNQAGVDVSKAEAVANEVLAAPNASPAARHRATFCLLEASLEKMEGTDKTARNPAAVDDFQKALATYLAQYPGDLGRVDALRLTLAHTVARTRDVAKAETMYQALTTSPNPKVARIAQSILKVRGMMNKPMDLKFTAVDGREVDLGKLQGKVVIIDYWATWCGPCMKSMPEMLKLYSDYHDKGLEIVGISLDQSKDRLLAVTKEQHISWPQYFDGKGWQNDIATSYGISSIPRMWLINKKGELVDTKGRTDLAAKVATLLAE